MLKTRSRPYFEVGMGKNAAHVQKVKTSTMQETLQKKNLVNIADHFPSKMYNRTGIFLNSKIKKQGAGVKE